MYLALYHRHVPLVLRPIDEPFTVDQEDSLFYVRILDRTINSKREHVDDVNELLSTAQSCQGLIPHRQQQICTGTFFNVHDTSDIRPSILSDSLLKAKADLASSFHNVRYSPSHYLLLEICLINGVAQMPLSLYLISLGQHSAVLILSAPSICSDPRKLHVCFHQWYRSSTIVFASTVDMPTTV